jgi:hypothetical protein
MLMMMLLSHAGDSAAEATWLCHDVDAESCWRWRYRVMLAMVVSRQLGRDAMSVPSHADDGTAESISQWCY